MDVAGDERWVVRMGMPDRFDADEWKDKSSGEVLDS